MSFKPSTPWHKTSYDKFLNERCPQLVSERLPLTNYAVATKSPYLCCVHLTVGDDTHTADVQYELPYPDEQGIFQIGSISKLVVPIATSARLDQAEIECVGEQLYGYIEARLGKASSDLPWDADLLRAWFPLDLWIHQFFAGVGERFITPQQVDDTNWLSYHTHLRRLIISDFEDVISPGQLGYVCPFETPEGANVGHVLTIARGAEIRNGHMDLVANKPVDNLGLSASMIPFLKHTDPNRLLMGANMLRQWIPQQESEPALVQTGLEPDTRISPEFWTGRNLLTAFISWGPGTYEDGIIVSESCSQRFDTPYPLQVGDKLSNRHGTKGVVSQILPDDEIPHLPDGTPVDILVNYVKVHSRWNFGQILEALQGRIAHITGEIAIVPPFDSPQNSELQDNCQKASISETGMEILAQGKDGPSLKQPSTVGYVYWGRLIHLAKDKLIVYTDPEKQWGQRIGEMETYMLRDLGAYENIRESLNLRSVCNPDAGSMEQRLRTAPLSQASPPTPLFNELCQRLRVAGIDAVLEDEQLHFRFSRSNENIIKFIRPIPHPWLPEHTLFELDTRFFEEKDASESPLHLAFASVIEANNRLRRMVETHTPGNLVEDAIQKLKDRVRALFAQLLTPAHLKIGERVLYSGRAVLVPGDSLSLEQLGMPESMAWELFEPLVLRQLQDNGDAVAKRTQTASAILDKVMADSWVILNRAPTFEPTALLAFHPVRVKDDALHLHPLLCKWLNADFDGDQAAIYLPITAASQTEAEERLSVSAHLNRAPGLLSSLLPNLEMLWGLAYLSRQPEGLSRISQIVGEAIVPATDVITQDTLLHVMTRLLDRDGIATTLDVLEKLMRLGFEVSMRSGASISPLTGSHMVLPSVPESDDAEIWSIYIETVMEMIAASKDYEDADYGPQLLMLKAAEKSPEQFSHLLTGYGPIRDAEGRALYIRHGYGEGLTPDEMFAAVVSARQGLNSLQAEWYRMGNSFQEMNVSRSYNVIPRALRAQHPGLIFARAAKNQESDPLTDVESRMLVGLPIHED